MYDIYLIPRQIIYKSVQKGKNQLENQVKTMKPPGRSKLLKRY